MFYWEFCEIFKNNLFIEHLRWLLRVITWKKTLIKASCTNNIQTGANVFCSCYFWSFLSRFFFRQKKTWGRLWYVWAFFAFLERRRPSKYCLREVNLVFYMYVQFDVPERKSILKNSRWKCKWRTQNCYDFRAPIRCLGLEVVLRKVF